MDVAYVQPMERDLVRIGGDFGVPRLTVLFSLCELSNDGDS